jgi:hypothetical protein
MQSYLLASGWLLKRGEAVAADDDQRDESHRRNLSEHQCLTFMSPIAAASPSI